MYIYLRFNSELTVKRGGRGKGKGELTVKGAPKTPLESSLNSDLTVKGEGSPRGAYIYIYIYVCVMYTCVMYTCVMYTCVMYTCIRV